MARKQEFRADREKGSLLDRLILTQQQRQRATKWALQGLMCLAALLLQDVLLYRLDILGAGTDLVPCLILLIALQQDVESGGLFALITGLLYYGSGSAPGPQVIVFITGLSVLLIIFRQSYLQEGFLAVLLCCAVGLLVYELCVFATGLITGVTMLSRLGVMVLTTLWSLAAVPVCYPMVLAIEKQGGNQWKE